MDDTILLPVGTVLRGQYAVEGVLGKPGGFGVVYLARDTSLDAHVAVKEFFPRSLASRSPDGLTLRPNTPDDAAGLEAGRQRFLEEARMLARFQHPNVVRVRSFFEENGTAYLVMDYLDGLPLWQYLERQGGKVHYETALGIAQPILSALTELHGAGILHRDIDPHNIYITRRGEVMLLDFGSAREATEEVTRGLSVVVKPGYAPYEQYGSRSKQGPWTDVYAVGATLYRLVTGVVPPPATERIAEDDLRPVRSLVPDVPASVARAIEHALAVQPQDRPQSAEAFEAELLNADEGPPLDPEPAVPVAAAPPPRQAPAPAPAYDAPPPRRVM
jgi:serine/threonine protein kinase